jgi:hypothetical protein
MLRYESGSTLIYTSAGIESKENQLIQFFEDRQFAECRYAIDASKVV